jgi:4-amino-4-deoxy-L-arabinose transferase-like glycosyltransferase
MVYLFWVVLILFSVVQSKVVHYSSLCYFPLTFLCAHYLYRLLKNRTHIRKWNVIVLISISIAYGIAIIAASNIDRYKTAIIDTGLIKHAFAIGNLEADGQWTGFESLIGVLLTAGIIIGTRYLKRKPEVGVTFIFATVIIFTYTAYIFVTPRVERYSQNAAIEFFKKLENKDAYAETLGYKSYANLFYSKFQPQQHKRYLSKEWLCKGNIDKPAYFSTKIHKTAKYTQRYPKLEFLYKENGFAFYKIEPY